MYWVSSATGTCSGKCCQQCSVWQRGCHLPESSILYHQLYSKGIHSTVLWRYVLSAVSHNVFYIHVQVRTDTSSYSLFMYWEHSSLIITITHIFCSHYKTVGTTHKEFSSYDKDWQLPTFSLFVALAFPAHFSILWHCQFLYFCPGRVITMADPNRNYWILNKSHSFIAFHCASLLF